ncbi:TIGR00266 family protein [Candidatus Woesearchaeota archaeon]|nr:TIGR00266 family protein [Candidatus Woesearchaeota archaeon]
MKYTISGTVMQSVNIELKKGQSIIGERGGMSWMSDNIDYSTKMKGGVTGAIKRKLGGESIFMTTFTCNEGTGMVSFCLDLPGKVIPIQIKKGQIFICQKDSFLCAEKTVNLDIEFRKLGRGFFGGEGFVLQKLSGHGLAFIESAGEVLEYELKKGQTLRVDTGHIVMYEPSVDYDIERVRGARNILFGAEGLFLATLTGPGKVWLQTITGKNLASKIARQFAPKKTGLISNIIGGAGP